MLEPKDLELIKELMQETIKPISERLDKIESGLKKVENRLDRVENKLDMVAFKQDAARKKLDDLSLDVKWSEREIRRDITHLQDTTETMVLVLQGKGILPKAQ